jgi:glutamine amidotransferase
VRQPNSNPLFAGISDSAFFYFVHSYYCEPTEPEVIAGETDYGGRYASVVARENLFGVQFHPEKSQRDGLRMLANFAQL